MRFEGNKRVSPVDIWSRTYLGETMSSAKFLLYEGTCSVREKMRVTWVEMSETGVKR